MRLSKYIIIILVFFSISVNAYSQKEENENTKNLKNKIFFGGSFSLQFGSITAINIDPVIGIRPIPRLSMGIGGKYQYYNSRSDVFNNYETHIFGGSIFSEYVIIKDLKNVLPVKVFGGLFTHIEYEALSLESKYFDISNTNIGKDRFWLNSFLLGGGYNQKIGNKSYIYILVLWNVTETINTPYTNPIYRIGFVF